MSQKPEERSAYNLRSRNNKNNVTQNDVAGIVDSVIKKNENIKTLGNRSKEEDNEVLESGDDEVLESGDDEVLESGDDECESGNDECESGDDECEEDELILEMPEDVIEEINNAIQELIQEITEDIVEKISEIVVTSVENNLLEEGEGENNEEEEDSDFSPHDNVFKFLEENAAGTEGFYPRKKLLLSKDRWQKGLTLEEIEKYKYVFDQHKVQTRLTIPSIIRSKLSDLEKEKAIKQYLHSHPGSNSGDEIVKTIEERAKNPISPEKLVEMDELEKQLSCIKDNRSSFKDKIYNLPLSIEKKSVIYEKYLQFETLVSSNAEASKLREWLNWSIKLPWEKSYQLPDLKNDEKGVTLFMKNIKKELEAVYGLKNAKEEIMMFVLKRLMQNNTEDNNSKTSLGGQILAIEGAPGVGKTYLLKNLANALKIPFESIPLGGCKDASFLDGHGYTYEGSLPGRIVQALKNMQCNNGIIYFDEIDKLSESQHGQEVSALMLHILDPSQNKEFYDKYIGDIPIDLSKIFFVLSINDRKQIDHVLRQRLFIIKIPDPTVKDKIEIAKQCMVPVIEKEFGFNDGDIMFEKGTLNYIIQSKTNKEKGVRNFKHLLLAIYKRLLFIHKTSVDSHTNELDVSFWIDDFKLPFTVTSDTVNHLLKGINQNSDIGDGVKGMYI